MVGAIAIQVRQAELLNTRPALHVCFIDLLLVECQCDCVAHPRLIVVCGATKGITYHIPHWTEMLVTHESSGVMNLGPYLVWILIRNGPYWGLFRINYRNGRNGI